MGTRNLLPLNHAGSHECDFPLEYKDLPTLTISNIVFTNSSDVDRQVREQLTSGAGLYSVDQELLRTLRPDIIVTQSLCKVCSVDYCLVESIASGMVPPPAVLDTNPMCLADMLRDIRRIGAVMGLEAAAEAAVNRLQVRIDNAVTMASALKAPMRTPTVGFCEWTDPIFPGGHWTPQLIEMAGGRHPLNPCKDGAGAAPSAAVTHEQFILMDPDVIIIAPCGLDLKATKKELEPLIGSPWWSNLRAVKERNVWLVDGNQMFNRPGPRLVDALEWLVTVLHECPEYYMEKVSTFPAERFSEM